MMWIVLQSKLGAVNVGAVVDIYISKDATRFSIIARIAPEVSARDAAMKTTINLGTYDSDDEAKRVFESIVEFIGDFAIGEHIFRMPAKGVKND